MKYNNDGELGAKFEVVSNTEKQKWTTPLAE